MKPPKGSKSEALHLRLILGFLLRTFPPISSEPPSNFASVSKKVLTLSECVNTEWLPVSSPEFAKPSYPMIYETMSERICSSCFERAFAMTPCCHALVYIRTFPAHLLLSSETFFKNNPHSPRSISQEYIWTPLLVQRYLFLPPILFCL